MLETEIKKLTAAVDANTAALLGNVVSTPPAVAPAPAPAAPAPAAPAPAAPTPPAAADATYEQVTKAITTVARDVSRESAVKLLADYGAVKVPDLKKDPSKYGEIVAKAEAMLA
jgi:2-oxoglutarate dehydrogenase E2 component (dihydrolipoamide succinyltransferase)